MDPAASFDRPSATGSAGLGETLRGGGPKTRLYLLFGAADGGLTRRPAVHGLTDRMQRKR